MSKSRHPRTKRPPRHMAPIGDRDIDRWVAEGMCAYGSGVKNVLAGGLGGAVMPWLVAAAVLIYTRVNNLFAPVYLRARFGPAEWWEWVTGYGPVLLWTSVLFGMIGAAAAVARRSSVRWRLQVSWLQGRPLADYLVSSHWVAAACGWLVYGVWAMWPRGDGSYTYSGALQHPWIWLFFGVILSAYLHWAHDTFLYRLYYREWDAACKAVVERLLKGHMQVRTPLDVAADLDGGEVRVHGFPAGHGAPRLKDLVSRIPGVRRVHIAEAGGDADPGREIITLHIAPYDESTAQMGLIRLGRALFVLGVAAGPIAYVTSWLYFVAVGNFFARAHVVIAIAFQAELAGFLLGLGARTALTRRAQRDLPLQLNRALSFLGKEIKGFAFGTTWEEAHVVADLTRREAREALAPVAARFGVKRLLVAIPVANRSGEEGGPVRRYGWKGA